MNINLHYQATQKCKLNYEWALIENNFLYFFAFLNYLCKRKTSQRASIHLATTDLCSSQLNVPQRYPQTHGWDSQLITYAVGYDMDQLCIIILHGRVLAIVLQHFFGCEYTNTQQTELFPQASADIWTDHNSSHIFHQILKLFRFYLVGSYVRPSEEASQLSVEICWSPYPPVLLSSPALKPFTYNIESWRVNLSSAPLQFFT